MTDAKGVIINAANTTSIPKMTPLRAFFGLIFESLSIKIPFHIDLGTPEYLSVKCRTPPKQSYRQGKQQKNASGECACGAHQLACVDAISYVTLDIFQNLIIET